VKENKFSLFISRFSIIALDNYNFALYETREKKEFQGKLEKGETKKLHGYYSNLASALHKIVNLALLTKDEHYIVSSLKDDLNALYQSVNDRFNNIKPKQFTKGEEL